MTGQAATGRLAAARVGQVGIWSGALASATAADARAAVGQMEALGYGAVWFGETPRLGREAFTHAGLLLAATHRMSVATGIANIWLRHPAAAAAAAHTLAEAYPGRFVLGLGASHAAALSLVGGTYDKPLSAMRTYLGQMAEATYLGPAPEHPVPVVVAALRHRMQELARDFADGMHSFFVDPAHTRAARALLGPVPLLAPEQAVVVDADPDSARRRARKHVQSRLGLPNYVNNVRALGYSDQDLDGGGSDALVDGLIAWGDAPTVAARIQAHLDAGADHVAVHPLETRQDPFGLEQLATLAPYVVPPAKAR